jgi:hypothetical protein
LLAVEGRKFRIVRAVEELRLSLLSEEMAAGNEGISTCG